MALAHLTGETLEDWLLVVHPNPTDEAVVNEATSNQGTVAATATTATTTATGNAGSSGGNNWGSSGDEDADLAAAIAASLADMNNTPADAGGSGADGSADDNADVNADGDADDNGSNADGDDEADSGPTDQDLVAAREKLTKAAEAKREEIRKGLAWLPSMARGLSTLRTLCGDGALETSILEDLFCRSFYDPEAAVRLSLADVAAAGSEGLTVTVPMSCEAIEFRLGDAPFPRDGTALVFSVAETKEVASDTAGGDPATETVMVTKCAVFGNKAAKSVTIDGCHGTVVVTRMPSNELPVVWFDRHENYGKPHA